MKTQKDILWISIAYLLAHFLTTLTGAYGYFRDELYYIACSKHLAWGYVDQPPLSIFVLAINRLLFGDSLFALRLLPALCGAAFIFVVGGAQSSKATLRSMTLVSSFPLCNDSIIRQHGV